MDNKSSDVAVKVESTIGNKETEQGRQSSDPTVKKNMREERSRKKDDKSVEQVLKALNSLETTEEKLAAMCKKYTDIVDENRKLQLTAKQTEKRFSMVQREKEQLQTEHSKAVLTRSRLESLCRELQRQNKAIKDESLLKIREEEEKRKEVSAKFQSTLNEITTLMQQNNEKNSKLREDNLEMTKKFKTVCEQYELREQQVEKITKQMQLEAQLSDAKLAKAKMEMAAEKEALLREKQQLLMDLSEYQSKCQELQTTEINLRSQINLYTDKYDEFQNALSRSNEVFGGFKGEMEKMSKKIIKLEKETSSWKQRWEKSHQALLEMAADKQQRDGELSLATRQLAQLQKLCRTLQAERTSLLAQLKTEGAAKIGDTVGRGDVPLESVQQSQEVATATSQCPANAEYCRHELEKQTRAEEPKNYHKNIDIVQQNEESSSPSEGIPNDNTQPNLDMKPGLNEKSVAAEPQNSSVAENVSCVTEVQKEATNEQNSAQEPSLSCKSVPTPEFVVNPKESAINGISNIKHLGNADSQDSQPEKSSVMSISTTEEEKCVTENHIKSAKKKEESDVKSATAINEGELNKQEYSPESIINGQMPAAVIINSTILPNDQEFTENKEFPVADVNTACNTNHVSGNEVGEPAKVGGPETKKGKEGAKKRKNK